MANTSLYDLAILNRADPYTGLVEDVTTLPAEWGTFAAYTRPGTTWYEITRRIALPTAQFRIPNSGTSTSKSIYKKDIKELFFLDTQLQMDEAIWDADPASLGPLWMREAEGAMRSAAILIGQQTWYGTSADSGGFTGARSQIAQSVAAGGTTSSTSAYLCWMDEKEGCRYDVGTGSFAISPPFRQQVKDTSSNTFFAYVGNLKTWIGWSIMSDYSVFAVTGISTTINQWLTDGAAGRLIAKIPVARRNNLRWFINRTSQATLQQSRSTINIGMGTGAYAVQSNQAIASYQPAGADGRPGFGPLPEFLAGYPISLTDSILDTETNS